jgi:hypothetical protein
MNSAMVDCCDFPLSTNLIAPELLPLENRKWKSSTDDISCFGLRIKQV